MGALELKTIYFKNPLLLCPLTIKPKSSTNLSWHTFINRYCLGYRPITRMKLDVEVPGDSI